MAEHTLLRVSTVAPRGASALSESACSRERPPRELLTEPLGDDTLRQASEVERAAWQAIATAPPEGP
eukprot:2421740-Alexandrium_andersonii.AAC.1